MMGVLNGMSQEQGLPNCCSTFMYLPSFIWGIVVLALVEFLLLLCGLKVLLTRSPTPNPIFAMEVENQGCSVSMKGNAWIAPLPEGDWSTAISEQALKKDKTGQKEGSRRGESRRDSLVIAPKWRHAVLRDKVLLLTDADGSEERILLEGCEVLSVSSGPGPRRKWGKKLPIKLHHPDRTLYRGCRDCLFYSESGYEKEAWCEAFRAMARIGSLSNEWFLKMKREFRDYTGGLEAHLPYLNKFQLASKINCNNFMGMEEVSDDHKHPDEGLSKKKNLWKKLARRPSKGKDRKDTKFSNAVDEVTRRLARHHQEKNEGNAKKKEKDEGSAERKESAINNDSQDGDRAFNASSASSTSSLSAIQGEAAVSDSEGDSSAVELTQDTEEYFEPATAGNYRHVLSKERPGKEIDQGLLCLNMIVARLYFDFYHSPSRVARVQRLFQRLVSKVRTPSYIKSITIKELDLGRDPPFATALRMLPSEEGGALSLEIDLEWHGGGFITCETRLDVRDQTAQDKVASQLTESGSAGAAAAAILSGIGGHLETTESAKLSSAVVEAREAGVSSSSRSGDEGNRRGFLHSVKSVMSRVADQVSQVPLLLKIRLVSLKGTGLLRFRAPPSDRIWFAFKEMPEIDLVPEPCIGDRRISSGPLGAFIANQLKVQIRESVVMPYCEDIFVDWMMAEKDDWLPLSTVPVPFSSFQDSESKRQNSKRCRDTQPRPSDENHGIGRPPSSGLRGTFNGKMKPRRCLSHSDLPGPPKAQRPPPTPMPQVQSTSESEKILATHPSVSRTLSSLQGPDLSFAHSRRSASLAHIPSDFSFSTQPSETITPLPSLSMRANLESDLARSRRDEDEYDAGEVWPLGRELDAGSSEKALEAAYTDLLLQSEGSASESDLQLLAHQETSKVDQGSKVKRGSRMLSLGKKMGTRLEERSRNVLDKLQNRKADGTESSFRSQTSD